VKAAHETRLKRDLFRIPDIHVAERVVAFDVTPASEVPAARQALAMLLAMAQLPGPVPAAALARDLGVPQSTTYHLPTELVRAGFVVTCPRSAAAARGQRVVARLRLSAAGAAGLAPPSREVRGEGRAVHVSADLGQDDLGLWADAGSGLQQLELVRPRPPGLRDQLVELRAELGACPRRRREGST
jgi:hypothetical protein